MCRLPWLGVAGEVAGGGDEEDATEEGEAMPALALALEEAGGMEICSERTLGNKMPAAVCGSISLHSFNDRCRNLGNPATTLRSDLHVTLVASSSNLDTRGDQSVKATGPSIGTHARTARLVRHLTASSATGSTDH